MKLQFSMTTSLVRRPSAAAVELPATPVRQPRNQQWLTVTLSARAKTPASAGVSKVKPSSTTYAGPSASTVQAVLSGVARFGRAPPAGATFIVRLFGSGTP